MRNDEDATSTTAAVIIASRQGRSGCKRARRGHRDHKSIHHSASASFLVLISMLLGWTWTWTCSSSRTAMRGVFVSGFASLRTKYPQSRSQWNVHALSKLQFRHEESLDGRKSAFAVRHYHHSTCYSTASAEQDTPTFAADFIPTTDSVSSTTTIETCYDRLFDMRLPEGRCVGLQLHELSEDDPNGLTARAIMDPDHTNTNTNHHWLHSLLHPEEVAYGMDRSCSNARESFFLGRLAMRQALGFGPHHVQTTDAILKDEYGRPAVPTGFLGSISHKRGTGVALVAVDDDSVPTESNDAAGSPRLGIGIDLEQICSQGKSSIARKVLTKREIEDLGRIAGLSSDEEVLLRFSIKESLYKAMHPLICQYVGFQEAEVQPQVDGSVLVRLDLKSGAHKRFGKVTAHWRKLPDLDFFLTSASVRLKESTEDESATQ